jgi:hypothetical protein
MHAAAPPGLDASAEVARETGREMERRDRIGDICHVPASAREGAGEVVAADLERRPPVIRRGQKDATRPAHM